MESKQSHLLSFTIPLLLLAIMALATPTQSENVLFILPISSRSHRNVFDPLVFALAAKGHQVTVVSSHKPAKTTPNVTELVPVDVWKNSVEALGNPLKLREAGIIGMMMMDTDFVNDGCHDLYRHPDFMGLRKTKFSLVFIDMLMNDCLYGFVHVLGAPFVIMSTLPAPSHIVGMVGLRQPPSFVPSPFLEMTDEMTFVERTLHLSFHIFMDVFMARYINLYEAIYREHLGQETPGMWEILGNVTMVFMNSHFSLTYPRPMLPDTLEIGGLHCGPAKPLPKDLEEFVSGAKDGFIFFSLGSIVQAEHMREDIRKIFVKTFAALKQRVVWKWENEKMDDLPPNVKLVKWAPQQSLLAHKNIKLFITHGGLLSIQEATYHGVPVIGIPIFADQDLNAKKAERAGYGVMIEILKMTQESLGSAIQKVLTDPSFSTKVKEVSRIFRDESESPLDRAVFWSEYIIRHKGAPHLRSASRKLNWFQYHSLDTIGALTGVLILIVWLVKCLVMLIVRKLCGLVGGKKKDSGKKNE